jgi:hypothetical protein
MFLEILVVVLLLMLDDFSNSCMRARSLGIAAKIKIMGEPFFSIYRFMVWYSCLTYAAVFEKVRNCVMEEE